MLSGEATTNTNFIVFGLTRSGLEPTIYHTRGEHVNHYTTHTVKIAWKCPRCRNGNNNTCIFLDNSDGRENTIRQ